MSADKMIHDLYYQSVQDPPPPERKEIQRKHRLHSHEIVEELEKSLDEGQNKSLRALLDLWMKMEVCECEKAFSSGFKLGAKLGFEVFSDGM